MIITIEINGSMTPPELLELTFGTDEDENDEICVSFKDKEVDLYVDFNELKSAIDALYLLKGK